jgi:drug/metabolite transporter (DMT)-like permease
MCANDWTDRSSVCANSESDLGCSDTARVDVDTAQMSSRRPPRALIAEIALLAVAAIWGLAFVAQRRGMDHMGPFLFNGLRFALGCLPLIPFLLRSSGTSRVTPERVGLRGVFLGLVLFVAASLQQVGIVYTTVGKAGFITALYVVLVPILGLLGGSRIPRHVMAGVMMAAVGLYLLTMVGDAGSARGPREAANLGDLLMLACALFWAIHILLVGRWAGRMPWPRLALTQFATCSAVSLLSAVLFEPIIWTQVADAALPILYAGLLSVGVGYTLQVVAQRHAPPTPAAIIMSLETVFAVIGGWWLLGERMGSTELTGCALMLLAMVIASVRRPD